MNRAQQSPWGRPASANPRAGTGAALATPRGSYQGAGRAARPLAQWPGQDRHRQGGTFLFSTSLPDGLDCEQARLACAQALAALAEGRGR